MSALLHFEDFAAGQEYDLGSRTLDRAAVRAAEESADAYQSVWRPGGPYGAL